MAGCVSRAGESWEALASMVSQRHGATQGLALGFQDLHILVSSEKRGETAFPLRAEKDCVG